MNRILFILVICLIAFSSYAQQQDTIAVDSFYIDGKTESIISPPSQVSASDGEFDTHILVKWENLGDGYTYQIYRSAPELKEAYTQLQTGTIRSNYFIDRKGLRPKITYYYKIVAIRWNVLSSAYSIEDTGYILQTDPMAAPKDTIKDDVFGLLLVSERSQYVADVAVPKDAEKQDLKPFLLAARTVADSTSSMYYGLATLLEYYHNLKTNEKINLSPDYLRLQTAAAPKARRLDVALEQLQSKGTVSTKELPYGSQNLRQELSTATHYKTDYVLPLFQANTNVDVRLLECKTALQRGNPLLLELDVTPNFTQLNKADAFWLPEGEVSQRTHLLVVGYDDSKSAFEVLHFNGTAWGNSGFAWVSYADFKTYGQRGAALLVNE